MFAPGVMTEHANHPRAHGTDNPPFPLGPDVS